MDLHAAARYAREAYSGLTRPVSTLDDVSQSEDGGEGVRGVARGGEERASGEVLGEEDVSMCGSAPGERLSLDIGVAAPNIYLYENVHDARTTAPVLVVRLGHLSLLDTSKAAEGGGDREGAAGQALGQVVRNNYTLEVEKVGVDLLHDVTLPLGNDGEWLKGVRSSVIIDDTRLAASLVLQLPSAASNDTSIHSGGRKNGIRVEVEADLNAINVHANTAVLCDIVRIAAS